jgi:hypothetical protein
MFAHLLPVPVPCGTHKTDINFHPVPGTDKEDPNIPDQDPTFYVTLESDPDPDPGSSTEWQITV